jgi:ABC-type multidrug transport system fused ATPase/permease subunit
MRKIYALLEPAFRKKALILLVLMFIGIIVELLGLGMILPLLSILSTENMAETYPQTVPLLEWLGNPTQRELVSFALGTLVVIYLLKGFYLVFLAWYQTNYAYSLSAHLSSKLLRGYMAKPYSFHLGKNSADLIQNLTGEVSQLTAATTNLFMLITEASAIIGIMILLVLVEPMGALTVMVLFGLLAILFHRLTKRKLLSWGNQRQVHDGYRYQYLLQSFGGVKDIMLLGKARYFTNRFQHHNSSSFNLNIKYATLQHVPRLWFEVVGVIGMVLLIVSLVYQGRPLEAIIPTLAIFVAAAFRIIPSLNRMVAAVQTIKYAEPSINRLHAENLAFQELADQVETNPLRFREKIELRDVAFNYEGTEGEYLKVNLNIPVGKTIGFIGKSGSGKSTSVDIILGLLKPNSGKVLVDGVDIQSNIRGWQNQIGYVPQTIYFLDDTLRSNIAFGLEADQIDESAVLDAVKLAKIEEFVASLPEGLDTMIGENGVRISGGQRQRIGIARALYHKPSVLVLDEATSALDNATEDGIMHSIAALHGEKTIIIVAHRLRTVAMCDQLFLMDKGKVLKTGSYEEVMNNDQAYKIHVKCKKLS